MLAGLLAWLDAPALTLIGVPVSWAEVLGDVTGAACVALLARQNVLTWPLGLLNNVFWALLFFRARLYADSVLQGVFFVLGVWGWWRWMHPDRGAKAVPVRRITRAEAMTLAALVMPATALAALALGRFTDSPAPLADASVLTLSLAATWGQAHKVIESWWVWIVVDVISVPLYVSRALYPTALLYVVFGVLCVVGLRAWGRDLAAQAPREAEAT